MNTCLTDHIIPKEICKFIINEYFDKVMSIRTVNRCQSVYHETNKSSWLFKYIDNLIKQNLGNNYHLLQRVTVLKYKKGDFFLRHSDGPWNSKITKNLPNHFYGGVELSDNGDYTGGEFEIEGSPVEFTQGRICTQSYDALHEVKLVKGGIRWSLHFLIYIKNKSDVI